MTDGVRGGAAHEQQSGVALIRVTLGNLSFEKRQDGTCTGDSCPLTMTPDDWEVDMDDLPEGQHTLRIEAHDVAGNPAAVVTRAIHVPRDLTYGQRLDQWRQQTSKRVDDANPLPLTAAMPTPPDHWRKPDSCEADTASLKACFDRNEQWAAAIGKWLNDNPMLTSSAKDLPKPPTYDYALSHTSRDLTSAMSEMFAIEAHAAQDPAAVLRTAIAFHEPRTADQVLAMFPTIGLDGGVSLRGVFDPGGYNITLGYRSTLPKLLTGHLSDFYAIHTTQGLEDISEFESEMRGEVSGDGLLAQDVAALGHARDGEKAMQPVLASRGPLIIGVVANMAVGTVRAAVETAGASIKTAALPASTLDAEDVLAGSVADAEAVQSAGKTRSSSRASASTADPNNAYKRGLGPTCVQAGNAGTDSKSGVHFAPRTFGAKVALTGDPDGAGYYKKRASTRMLWVGPALNWFCGDGARERAFEPETKHKENQDPKWATDQNESSWKSNMPQPYLDDLNGGWREGFTPDDYPDFAVGSANGKALEYGVMYYTRNILTQGESNEGDASIRAESNHRAGNVSEEGYCTGRGRTDASCYFRTRDCYAFSVVLRAPRIQYIRPNWAALEAAKNCSS